MNQEQRQKYRRILEWIVKNTPYNQLNIDGILSFDETWFGDYSFPLTLDELLRLVTELNDE